MLKKDVSSFELHYKIRNFLMENKSGYTKKEQEFILNNCTWGQRTGFVPDVLRQIYDYLDLLDSHKNIYLGFLDLLEQKFNIDQNIIEVGGGRLPCLGRHLALKQHQGTVTVYDPKLLSTTSRLSNLKLKKENFTATSDLNNKQLIIGFMPCAATDILLRTACANNIDFMVALCDGISDETDLNIDEDEYAWQAGVIYDTKKYLSTSNLGTLEFANLESYDDPYPIIYNKRK